MIQKPTYEKHFISLAAIFILGESVIGMPYSFADDKTILGFIIAAIIAFILYSAVLPIVNIITHSGISNNSSIGVKIGICLIFTVVSIYSLFCAATSFKSFVRFVSINLLQNTPKFFICVIMLVVIAFIAGKRQGVLLKFSLIAFCAIAAAILLFLALSSDQFDFRNILLFNVPSFSQISGQTIPYIIKVVFPALLIPVYQAVVFKQSKPSSCFYGLSFGLILLVLCILNSVLIFGAPLAAKLDFPYASAISTVTIGQLFTRMDGFSYFIYFASSLIKITVCIDIVVGLLKKLNVIFNKRQKIASTDKEAEN